MAQFSSNFEFANNSQKFLNTTSTLRSNPKGATPNLSPSDAKAVIKPNSTAKITQRSAIPQTGQPSTTPDKGFNQVVTGQDAYRNGNSSGTGADPLLNSRVLGEGADQIASISLSSDTALNTQTSQGDVLSAYSRFFLQSVTEAQTEKFQIVETFTAFYTFFYGKRPPVYSFRGMLMNDENHKWTNDFMFFYENFLRGTRSVELNSQALLSYDGRLVSGFILNLNIQQNADLHKGAAFSIDVLVTDHLQVNFSSDIADLIAKAQVDLQATAARINQQISTVNRSIPSGKALSTYRAISGKDPFITSTVSGTTKTPRPVNFGSSNIGALRASGG